MDAIERQTGASQAHGSVKRNAAPPVTLFSAHKRPPCDSTMARQSARPILMPSRCVVKSDLVAGYTRPRVQHGYLDDPGFFGPPLDDYAPGTSRPTLYGVHAVDEQIEQDLRNVRAIRHDARQTRLNAAYERDASCGCLRSG
jgi:hypothetical protein